jgi:DnaJ-class molecular chaperone
MIIIFKGTCQRCQGLGYVKAKPDKTAHPSKRCEVCDGEGQAMTVQGDQFFKTLGRESLKVNKGLKNDLRKS